MKCNVGWEGENGAASYYIQGGPALFRCGCSHLVQSTLSSPVKLCGAVAVSESVSVYGELSLATAAENELWCKRGNEIFLLDSHRNLSAWVLMIQAFLCVLNL